MKVAVFFNMVILIGSLAAQETERASLPKSSIRLGRVMIDLRGNYRLRAESQKGFNIKHYAAEDDDFLLSRLRLEADFLFSTVLQAHLQLQDSRALGIGLPDEAFSGNNPFHDPLDINQAFLEIVPHRTVKLSIGRQPITFRDRRIFGAGNWGNTGRYVWDAVKLKIENRFLDCHWIFGRYVYHNPQIWPNRTAEQPTAAAVYSSCKSLPLQLDIFYVHKNGWATSGNERLGDLRSHSIGYWLQKDWRNWRVGAVAVGQFGRQAKKRIRSYGSAVWAGLCLDDAGRFNVKAQFAYGSGDKNPYDNYVNTFDGVFGGAAPDIYGWMSLFFWKNLHEYRIDFQFRPVKGLRIINEYHYFTLDSARDAWYFINSKQRLDPLGASGRELGHEIDFVIGQNFSRRFELLSGYGLFLPGNFIKNTGAAPVCRKFFLQTTLFLY